MVTPHSKQILVAPLDWGLGHTTRCVPLIRHLRHLGHEVTIAGNNSQVKFLTEYFPSIRALPLQGYNVSYSRHPSAFMAKLLTQVPRMLKTVSDEHRWLQQQVQRYGFDGIISDNRYGLFHETIPSVIMTHQLQVQTGLGNTIDSLVRLQHYRYLNRFSECWIPDVDGPINLSGRLGHPNSLPLHTHYLGLVSQFEPPTQISEEHILILLSGPEPQRSMLADKIWRQISQISQPVVFVAGSDAIPRPEAIPPQVQYFGRLAQKELQPLLERASLVICRSGYSSLMDIAVLGKKAILIPTPGQTEQEYLANQLFRSGQFLYSSQKDFDLKNAIREAETFSFRQHFSAGDFIQYQSVLSNWLARL